MRSPVDGVPCPPARPVAVEASGAPAALRRRSSRRARGGSGPGTAPTRRSSRRSPGPRRRPPTRAAPRRRGEKRVGVGAPTGRTCPPRRFELGTLVVVEAGEDPTHPIEARPQGGEVPHPHPHAERVCPSSRPSVVPPPCDSHVARLLRRPGACPRVFPTTSSGAVGHEGARGDVGAMARRGVHHEAAQCLRRLLDAIEAGEILAETAACPPRALWQRPR